MKNLSNVSVDNVECSGYKVDYSTLYLLKNKESGIVIEEVPLKSIIDIYHESFHNNNLITMSKFNNESVILKFEKVDDLLEVKKDIKAKWLNYQQDRK